ncbi:MFS transporter [Halioxenophilus aromaticivorans]|uniref:MFS transporter n=1 Tax=Halioxenophilus aromaticivorans TaxID=1306992 RepID=A0AAV3U465_9ALTE
MIPYGTGAYWRITLALCLGSFLVFSCLYTTQPLMPILAKQFAVSELAASFSLTISTFALGLSLLIYGPLSDALGRRGLIVASIAGLFVTTLALSQVSTYPQLLALRAVQGFFIAGLPAIAVAYMADEFTPEALMHSVGIYIAANTLGGIGGRLMAGFIGEYLGWQQAFFAMGLLGVLVWCILLVALPKSLHFRPQSLQPHRILADLKTHLSNRLLLPAYILGGLNFLVFVNQFSFLTFVLESAPYHLSAKFLGMLFLVYLTGTAASALSGKLGNGFGQANCMLLGSALVIVGTLVTLLSPLPFIILGLLINSFGFFLAHSSASSWVSRNATHGKATASSLYLVFYYVGASVGGSYLNIFWQWQQWRGVVAGSISLLLVTCAMAVMLRGQQSLRATVAVP